MPLHMVTPLDEPHDGDASAVPELPVRARLSIRPLVADFCYLLLASAGFSISTCLMVLGVPLFAFLALAGWDYFAIRRFAQRHR